MTEKAILSAMIFTIIYLILNITMAKLIVKKEEIYYSDFTVSEGTYIPVFLVSTLIMLIYTNYWITVITLIILLGMFTTIFGKRVGLRIIRYSTFAFFVVSPVVITVNIAIDLDQAEQYIETESKNIVYDEDIKVKYLPQDTIYVEKVVLKEYHENYNYWEEDSYQYYYRIEENGGKTKSIAKEEIPASKVKIQYIKDNQKAMMKKICHTTYYKKKFFGIEVPMLKKSIETKYEFCIPEELLEVVEIK